MAQPRQFSLQIATKPVWTTAETIPVAQLGVAWRFVLAAKDALAYALQSGSLPPGVALTAAGQLKGTPSAEGVYAFTVRAVGEAPSVFADRAFSVPVAPLPAWVTGTVQDQVVGEPASFQFEAVGATAFALQTGALPAGLALSASGLLTGTPAAAGSSNFSVRASSDGASFVVDRNFAAQVREAPVWVTPAALSDAVQSVPTYVQLGATGGPQYYLSSGALPPGLALSAQGGVSGSPSAAGTFIFTVLASNAPGKGTPRAFSMSVAPKPLWTTPVAIELPVAAAATVQLVAAGAVSYAVLGAAPAGLAVSASGLVTGTPPSVGKFALQVRATTTATIFTTRTFEVVVYAQPAWTTPAALPVAFLGATAATVLSATDAFSYAVEAGSPPPGVALTASGKLEGAYAATGAYVWTVRASGTAASAFADRTFSLTVVAPPVWATPETLSFPANSAVSVQLSASDASGYVLLSGVVAGLSLSAGGLLSGTPTAAGTTTELLVRATTANTGVLTERAFSVTVT